MNGSVLVLKLGRFSFSALILGADMKVKDLSVAQFLLGIEIRRMQGGMKEGDILLVQEKYITEILKQFDMLDCKPASTHPPRAQCEAHPEGQPRR